MRLSSPGCGTHHLHFLGQDNCETASEELGEGGTAAAPKEDSGSPPFGDSEEDGSVASSSQPPVRFSLTIPTSFVFLSVPIED